MLNFIRNLSKRYKKPEIKENTFILWEPCSVSHSEVLPGYAKYLLDMGYHVSVIVNPERYKEGLFSKFKEENITFNKMNAKNVLKYFKYDSLEDVKGVMVTTVGKLCKDTNIDEAYTHFHPTVDRKKLLFVEHDIKIAVDENRLRKDVITLRKMNYKNAETIAINPHYFGDVAITPKNETITNFLTIGDIKPRKKDSGLIVEAVQKLYDKGYENFKVTVIGRGKLKGIPKKLHKFFDIKGRLPFSKMYEEIEKADFMLTAYDDKNPQHQRYNTRGTSGNFQLIYGFLKPCIIIESFAPINKFNSSNSILYKTVDEYAEALEKALNMNSEEYSKMQGSLKECKDEVYSESLNNLKGLINERNSCCV